MISLTAMLAGFGPEMRVTSRVRPEASATVDSYWSYVENMVFGARKKSRQASPLGRRLNS
jgi:hypothetical protein